jgi:hypothetical protein
VKKLIYGEAEYRGPITRNGFFGVVGFATLTTASNKQTGEKLFDSVAPSAGGGLRLLLNKQSQTHLCLDFAWGKRWGKRCLSGDPGCILNMNTQDQHLLDALLDSWDRNNTILINLLRAMSERELETRAMEGSPSIAALFTHIHFVRLVFVLEDAPEFARELPENEWALERDPDRIASMLNESARVVRDAVKAG